MMSCCLRGATRDLFGVAELLDRACDGRERVIGVVADQANCADNEHQDYSPASPHIPRCPDLLRLSTVSGGGRALHSFLGWSVFGLEGWLMQRLELLRSGRAT